MLFNLYIGYINYFQDNNDLNLKFKTLTKWINIH